MQEYSIKAAPGIISILLRPRGGDWLDQDVREWRREGMNTILSLLTSEEEREFELSKEGETVESAGMKFKSFPIPDRGLPDSRAGFLELVGGLRKEIQSGGKVGIHCRQGIGRSGLVAAGILIAGGAEPEMAIDKISQARGMIIPETNEQRDWILDMAKSIARQAA